MTEGRWVACGVHDLIDFGLKPGGELKIETTICDQIRQSHKAVVIDHVSKDAVFCNHPTPALYGFESYVSFPIILPNGDFFGTLCAIDPRPARVIPDPIEKGLPDMPTNAFFQYGVYEGIPRLLDLMDKHQVKLSSFMIGQAVDKAPDLAREIVMRGHEAAAHGRTWENSYLFDADAERARFPVAAPFVSPGLCIEYRPAADATSQRFCSGTQSTAAPKLFAALYRSSNRDVEVLRPVIFEGQIQGFAVVSIDMASLIEQSWHETGRLLVVVAVTLAVLCSLIYVAVDRMLRPTRIIVSGLEALSAKEFSTRLPKFDPAELSRSEVSSIHWPKRLSGRWPSGML